MAETALVSVIIPCYNQAHFVSEAIESVRAQTYPHYEIIVVNDGSTDDTAEVASRFPDVRLISQDNQGLAAARNAGWRASRGEYLIFLDADDRLLPNALQVGIDAMKAHPECALVSGHTNLITYDGTAIMDDGTSLNRQWSCGMKNDYYLALLNNNYMVLNSAMLQRAVLDSVGGFKPQIEGVADYDMCLRIAAKFPILCHHQTVAEYRQHRASMSRNNIMMLKHSLAVLRSHWKQIEGNKVYEAAYRGGWRYHQEIYSEGIIQQMRDQIRTPGGWKLVWRNVLFLLSYCPQMLARHSGRKLYCMVFRVKSDYDPTAQL